MRTRKEETGLLVKLIRPVLWGVCVGALTCLLLLLIMAAVMAAQNVPQTAVTPMAVAAAAAAAFLGGLTSARIAKERGLLVGVLCGLLMYVVVALAGFALLREIRGTYALLKLFVLVGCGAIGGLIGVNTKQSRRTH